jgi:hypothetical protein
MHAYEHYIYPWQYNHIFHGMSWQPSSPGSRRRRAGAFLETGAKARPRRPRAPAPPASWALPASRGGQGLPPPPRRRPPVDNPPRPTYFP